MVTANVALPEGIKIDKNEVYSVDSFLKLLYINQDDIEDFLDVKQAQENKNAKFYNFDDIVNEY